MPDQVRPIPPEGIAVPEEKAFALTRRLEVLGATLDALREASDHRDLVLAYLPDAEICHRAVRDALVHGEFFKDPEIAFALHPETLSEIEDRLSSISARGRETVPTTLRFVTYTLRYDRAH